MSTSSRCLASTRRCRPPMSCLEHSSRRSRPDHKKRTAHVERPCTKAWLRGLADPVDLRAADRTRPHRCGFAVLHRDRLRVLHLNLLLVFQTVAFHLFSPSKITFDPKREEPLLGAVLSISGYRALP